MYKLIGMIGSGLEHSLNEKLFRITDQFFAPDTPNRWHVFLNQQNKLSISCIDTDFKSPAALFNFNNDEDNKRLGIFRKFKQAISCDVVDCSFFDLLTSDTLYRESDYTNGILYYAMGDFPDLWNANVMMLDCSSDEYIALAVKSGEGLPVYYLKAQKPLNKIIFTNESNLLSSVKEAFDLKDCEISIMPQNEIWFVRMKDGKNIKINEYKISRAANDLGEPNVYDDIYGAEAHGM